MRTFVLLLLSAVCGPAQILTGALTGGPAVAAVALPTDSPGAGIYAGTQSVTLADVTAGSSILYTTDGSAPACPATGTTYTGAISVAATTTVKAIGCKALALDSFVLSSVYTISASCAGCALVDYGYAQDASSAVAPLSCGVAPAYSSGTTYGLGDRVQSGGIGYKSIQGGNTGHTVTDTLWWTPVDAGAANYYWSSVSFANGTPPTVSYGSGTPMTPVSTDVGGAASIRSFKAENVAGASVSFTAGTGSFMTLMAACFSGVATSPTTTDGTGATSSPGNTASPSITTSVPSLVIAAATGDSSAAMSGTGWTQILRPHTTGGVAYGGALGYKIQSVAGAENPSFTLTFTDSASSIASVH